MPISIINAICTVSKLDEGLARLFVKGLSSLNKCNDRELAKLVYKPGNIAMVLDSVLDWLAEGNIYDNKLSNSYSVCHPLSVQEMEIHKIMATIDGKLLELGHLPYSTYWTAVQTQLEKTRNASNYSSVLPSPKKIESYADFKKHLTNARDKINTIFNLPQS